MMKTVKSTTTPMERVRTTLSHKEPDKVPLFLLLTMHGAKELGVSIKEYFSKAENVIEGQIRLQKKFQNDCLLPFFYAPLEIQAFGGEVIFTEDGPPNSGTPFIQDIEKIKYLVAPVIQETKILHKVLQAIESLNKKARGTIPIIGVVMSPFSLPVMQIGFEKYFEIMYFRKDLFEKLMQINERFCVEWANAQLKAGATAIVYFDPVSSPTIVPYEKYLETGFIIAKRTLAQIKGPSVTHFASGTCFPITEQIVQTGTAGIGISASEDLLKLKHACKNKLTIIGNLNGIEMRRWSQSDVHEKVRSVIQKAAPGGGFILSDNHGEIPFQVPDEVLFALREAVDLYGKYPIVN